MSRKSKLFFSSMIIPDDINYYFRSLFNEDNIIFPKKTEIARNFKQLTDSSRN